MYHAGNSDQFLDYVGFRRFGKNTDPACNQYLCSKFCCRTLRYVQKTDEFRFRVSLCTFCDVGGNRDGGACHLIFETEISASSQFFIDPYGKVTRPLPDLQIFK